MNRELEEKRGGERRLLRVQLLFLLISGLLLLSMSGCRSAASHRERADSAALGIVEEQQQAALGRSEPFSIETPIETFRRRLLLDQHLPHLGAASFGSDALEEIEHWPETGEAPEALEAFFPGAADEEGVLSLDLLDALRVAEGNRRENRKRKEAWSV